MMYLIETRRMTVNYRHSEYMIKCKITKIKVNSESLCQF